MLYKLKFRIRYFNPRPPWGGRHNSAEKCNKNSNISIHALRGEGDGYQTKKKNYQQEFQSTPSVGRATGTNSKNCYTDKEFQSTPSVGRATPRKFTTN